MDFNTTGRSAFYLRCELKLTDYARQWVYCTQNGEEVEHLLSLQEDLTLGVEQLLAALPASSPFTATLISGLCDRHELMCIPITPFTAIPFCLNTGASTTPTHNQLTGLERVGPGTGYKHVSTELGIKLYNYFYPTLTAPGAPTIGASIAGNNTVRATWTAPTSNGNSPITGYKVYRNEGATPIATGITALYYDDTTAVNGTAYTYRVSAVNSVNEGQKSEDSAAVSPVAPTPPPGVTYNTTLNPGDNVSTVTWNAAAGVLLKINTPLSTANPTPATMLVFAPDGTTQLGQVDYNDADTGAVAGIVYNGTIYNKVLTNGTLILS